MKRTDTKARSPREQAPADTRAARPEVSLELERLEERIAPGFFSLSSTYDSLGKDNKSQGWLLG